MTDIIEKPVLILSPRAELFSKYLISIKQFIIILTIILNCLVFVVLSLNITTKWQSGFSDLVSRLFRDERSQTKFGDVCRLVASTCRTNQDLRVGKNCFEYCADVIFWSMWATVWKAFQDPRFFKTSVNEIQYLKALVWKS